MHNISISDIQPTVRRRCESEGKRAKSKPRPVSAVMYPTHRGRADTEPNAPLSPFRVGSASSTKNLSLSESPKSKQPSGLNRFLPRRKSKDGKEDNFRLGTMLVFYFVIWTVEV